MIVPRHDIDTPRAEKYHVKRAARVPSFLEGARKRATSLDLLIDEAMSSACSGAAAGVPLAEVKRLFRLAAQAYRALFLVVRAGDTYKVTVPLGEGEPVVYETETALDVSYLDPGRWLRAFFLAAVLRDEDLLTALVNTPTDLIRRSTIKGPEYQYTFIDALRTFIEGLPQRRRAAAMDLVSKAMHETDPDRPDVLDPDWTLLVDVPTIAVMFSLLEHVDLQEHEPKFGDRLAWALEKHKKYYTRDEMKRLDWEGFLSLRLLGLASLAFEYHIPFDVQSDYIPLPLIRNEV